MSRLFIARQCGFWVRSHGTAYQCGKEPTVWWMGRCNSDTDESFARGQLYLTGFCDEHKLTPIDLEEGWIFSSISNDEAWVFLTMEE